MGAGAGTAAAPTGASDRLLPETVAAAQITSGFLANRSVAVRNSLRTGLGLALAVAVTHVFPVEHGFWVVLGAMSVLRSSALTTGTKMGRAVIGTGIGFLLGAAVISVLGVDPVVLWVLMPIVVFGSAYVPEIASFTAAQAAFTMWVLIVFNLIAPTGWQVGLIRVEDVVVGALVGVMVSVLLWPRGATATASRAIAAARTIFVRYLRVAVRRITRGAFEAITNEVAKLSHDALAASRVADDAVRQYLSESSGETDFRAPIVRAFNRAIRLRSAADLIADIPTPPPLSSYPRVREVVELHVDAICDRLAGRLNPKQASGTDRRRLRARPAGRIRRRFSVGVRGAAAAHRRGIAGRIGADLPGTGRGARGVTVYRFEVCGISAFGGMVPNFPALKSSSAWISSDLEFITNGP